MSNADYTVRGSGPFCTVAELSASVNYLDDTFPLTGLSEASVGDRTVGMACMIDDEICKVTEINPTDVKVARGCADTVPAIHLDGAPVWFFESSVGGDSIAYGATDEIGVKLLAKTNSDIVPIAASPPQELVFNFRFARPYAPGLMKVNAVAWYLANPLIALTGGDAFVLTWTHRDRVVQADTLIPHGDGNIGPEPGVTYTAHVYDETDVLVATHSGITGTTWSYNFAMAAVDFGIAAGEAAGLHACKLIFCSTRDTLDSYQNYELNFSLDKTGITAGWGNGWGYDFGGT